MNLYKVVFGKYFRRKWRTRKAVMVFSNNIDDAKVEARKLRPDCSNIEIVEVRKIGGS